MMGRLYVALLALAGGMAEALLGWLEIRVEPFDPPRQVWRLGSPGVDCRRRFRGSYQLSHGWVTALDLFYAFLGGAGVDVLGTVSPRNWARENGSYLKTA